MSPALSVPPKSVTLGNGALNFCRVAQQLDRLRRGLVHDDERLRNVGDERDGVILEIGLPKLCRAWRRWIRPQAKRVGPHGGVCFVAQRLTNFAKTADANRT